MQILVFIFVFFVFNTSKAELLKPTPSLLPKEVISIQLSALKNNNNPYENAGIKQTWEFAHPLNRKFTGPLSNFINMMYSNDYSIMLDHRQHNIILLKKDINISYFFIELFDIDGNKFGFNWTVEKVLIEGEFKDCSMTLSVSKPMSLAKSV